MCHETEVKKTSSLLTWSILTSASIFDAMSYRIPNQLIILGYAAGIYFNLAEYGMQGFVHFICKASWPILALSILYLFGKQMGAGDIKLFSVMATTMGTRITVNTIILSVMLAAITIVLVSLYEGQLLKRKLHYSFYITAAFFLLSYN